VDGIGVIAALSFLAIWGCAGVELDWGYVMVFRFMSGGLPVFAVFKRLGDKPNIKLFSRLR